MLKLIWNDPVWSKVIAGAILAIAAATGAYFLDWWPSIWNWLSGVVAFAASSTSVPNWAIGLLILLALPLFFLVGALVWEGMKPTSDVAAWTQYTSDTFFAVKWRWRYSTDGQIYDLCSFCTSCDYQVFPQNLSSYRIVDHIGYRCDSCGLKLAEFEEPVETLESKVKRFIQQKLRTNTWAVPTG